MRWRVNFHTVHDARTCDRKRACHVTSHDFMAPFQERSISDARPQALCRHISLIVSNTSLDEANLPTPTARLRLSGASEGSSCDDWSLQLSERDPRVGPV